MSVKPEESWTIAEATSYLKLVERTASKDGSSSFLGVFPDGVYDAWALKTGGGGVGGQQNCKLMSVIMKATIEGEYRERAEAQRVAMLITSFLPIVKARNVQWFRFAEDGLPDIERVERSVANEDNTVFLWRFEMQCELIFNFGLEY